MPKSFDRVRTPYSWRHVISEPDIPRTSGEIARAVIRRGTAHGWGPYGTRGVLDPALTARFASVRGTRTLRRGPGHSDPPPGCGC
ncbi:hypothetical protein JOC24_005579 [Streptomyces sp. HB132]|nr:hypothetical protein [Streptomyces sp. HB132]